MPFLYAANNATGLGDLFKPTIQLSALGFTNHWLQFTVTGVVPGKTNFVQFTTNFPGTSFAAWMNLQTNVLTTNRFTFTDTNTGNAPWRFYRVIETY